MLSSKMLKLFALFFASVCAHNTYDRTHYEANYIAWMQKYKPLEGSFDLANGFGFAGKDFVKNLNTFADNSDKIEKHNKGNHSFTMAHNEFSDLTFAEFSALMLSSFTPLDHEADNETTSDIKWGSTSNSWDWRKKGCVSSVKHQQCGDCWSFSAAGAMEGAYCVKNGKLKEFSSQYLVDCDNVDHGCDGGLPSNAYNFIKGKGGICSLRDYGYGGGREGYCKSCSPVSGTKVRSYTSVGSKYSPASDKTMMAAIKKQPVSIAIDANDNVQFYSGGIFDGSCSTALNHAVLAIGYDKDSYIVKNSWGSSWGEKGYIRFKKGSYSGKCGLLTMGNYPNLY